MKIIVDEKEVDISLENEKTIEDFLLSFTGEINKMGRIVVKVTINGQPYADSMNSEPLTEDFQCEMVTEDKVVLMVSSLEFLLTNMELLEHDLEHDEAQLLNDQFNYNNLFGDIEFQLSPPLCAFFDKQIASYLADKTEANKKNILTILPHIKMALFERYEEFKHPEQQLEQTKQLLQTFNEHIEEIPVLFQSGEAKEALNKITFFTEILEKFNRLITIMPVNDEEETLKSIDFASILKQIAEAFENEDQVLIGDLMEYEISPKIEILISFIDRVTKKG